MELQSALKRLFTNCSPLSVEQKLERSHSIVQLSINVSVECEAVVLDTRTAPVISEYLSVMTMKN